MADRGPRGATPGPALPRAERVAAAVLLTGGPAAAFATLGVCLLATALVPVGWWRPAVVVPLLLPVVLGSGWLAHRLSGAAGTPGGPGGRAGQVRVPPWTAAAGVAVALGFGLWAGITHGEHLIIRRDAGSYALFAHWLATRHGLPVDAGLAAFGGPAALDVPGFTVASPAYFQVLTAGPAGAVTGADVVPQFLLGAPALYSLGWWPAGWGGLFVVPAVVAALAVLAAAGLAARLVGPAWAPVAAAGLALTQPVLHSARATLSEPPALLLLLAAAALAVDAVARGPHPGTRRLALAAGAVLGLAGLVRIDVLREVAILVPVCAVLAWRGHRAGVPLAGSALAGAGLAMIPAVALSRPYVDQIAPSLRPLVLGTAALTVACGAALAARPVIRRVGVPPSVARLASRWLPPSAGVAVLLAGALLVSRPAWSAVRQAPDDSAVPLVASLQGQQGLPVDGTRTYAERSVEWLTWYTGPVVALAALLAVAVAATVAVRLLLATGPGGADAGDPPRPDAAPEPGGGAVPAWLVPLAVGFGSAVLTLYRPGITPDHPWADRRLVPVVLPFVVIAAVAAAAWTARGLRRRPGLPAVVPRLVTAVAVAAVLVPAAVATWPLAGRRTEVGQPRAAADVCAALRPGDVVLAVADGGGGIRAQNEWVQVVRGVCGHPAAALVAPDAGPPPDLPAALERLGPLVDASGGRLVLLSAGEDDREAAASLTALGLDARRATRLRTTEDQHLLARRPDDLDSVVVDVWLAMWRTPPRR